MTTSQQSFNSVRCGLRAAQVALDSNAEHGQREALNPLPQNEEKS